MKSITLYSQYGDIVALFQISSDARLVKYKDEYYVRTGWGIYHQSDVVNLADPKVAKPRPDEIPNSDIEAARAAANQAGLVFKYRNRDGKQYVTLMWTAGTIKDQWWQAYRDVWSDPRYDRQFVKTFFPFAQHTSGSYGRDSGDHTYRINP